MSAAFLQSSSFHSINILPSLPCLVLTNVSVSLCTQNTNHKHRKLLALLTAALYFIGLRKWRSLACYYKTFICHGNVTSPDDCVWKCRLYSYE